MSFVNRILVKRANNNDLVRNLVKNNLNFKNYKYSNIGWLKDPLLSLNFSIPTYYEPNTHRLRSCADIHTKLIHQMMELNKTLSSNSSRDFYELAESYLDTVYNHKSLTLNNHPLNDKIMSIIESRFNYNPLSTVHKCSNSLLSNSNPASRTKDTVDALNHNNNHSSDISQYSDYNFMRISSAFFEKNNSRLLSVSGSNSEYFLDQILSSSVSGMCINDVEYACLLDSKGVILDTCLVSKLEDHFLLVTTGNKKNDVFDYISSYAVHLKAFALDICVKQLDKFRVANLYGPLSYEVFTDLLRDESSQITIHHMGESTFGDSSDPSKQTCDFVKLYMKISYINFMKDQKIICYRVSDVEEGIEFIIHTKCYSEFKNLLLSHKKVKTINSETYDIARLESGIISPDVDLTPESTPIHSSLMWTVDIKKIRTKLIFGHRNFSHNMVEGTSKMRVGLISNKMLTPSCKVLTKSTRKPIGMITSCAFSPALGMFISHCYVNRDYAKHDTPVVVSVPEKADETVSKAKYKKYYRNNILKTFCSATIVRLPFIKRNFNVANQNKPNSSQISYLKPKVVKMSEKKQLVRSEKSVGVKTKKQIWKDIIKKHKKQINKTLELACRKWEELNKETTEESCEVKLKSEKNKIDMDNINLKNALGYYKNKIGTDVSGRHRRYTPIRHTNHVIF